MRELTAISLFTGAMGFDLGFEQEGFSIKVALDTDLASKSTIEANGRNLPVITEDVADVTSETILEKAGLEVGEATVVIGAPPCEPFTTAGSRNGFKDHRSSAVREFIRVVKETRPRYFAFEEVPGFLRAAKRHMSFYERAKKRETEVDPEYRLGSAFDEVLADFQELGYSLSYNAQFPKASLLNAADFGTPQKRIRFIMIGSRRDPPVTLPEPTHHSPDLLSPSSGTMSSWVTLRHALEGLDTEDDEWLKFPQKWGQYLHMVEQGGCWRNLPEHLHRVVLGGAYDDGSDPETAGLKGGRTGFLRKLSWDKPSPTLVDRPTNKANCLCHPDEDRPLSIKEYARIQGFDDAWEFSGSLTQRYRLIGQATPVPLAAAIAKAIRQHMDFALSQNGHTENEDHVGTTRYEPKRASEYSIR